MTCFSSQICLWHLLAVEIHPTTVCTRVRPGNPLPMSPGLGILGKSSRWHKEKKRPRAFSPCEIRASLLTTHNESAVTLLASGHPRDPQGPLASRVSSAYGW